MSKPVKAKVNPQIVNSSALRSFFVTHPVRIKLAIFLILFLTFVAREGLRDHFKDRTNAIESAQSTATILSEVAYGGLERAQIIETLATLQETLIPPNVPLDDYHKGIGRQVLSLADRLEGTRWILRSLITLNDRADLGEESHQKVNRLIQEHIELIKKSNAMSEPLRTNTFVDNGKILALGTDIMKMDEEVIHLQDTMLRQANEARQKNERWLLYVTIVAYALYGVGAVLTVLSIVYKVGEPSAAGE